MDKTQRPDRIFEGSLGEKLAPDFLIQAGHAVSVRQLQQKLCRLIAARTGCSRVSIVQGTKGQWRVLATDEENEQTSGLESATITKTFPVEFVAEALDSNSAKHTQLESAELRCAVLGAEQFPGILLLGSWQGASTELGLEDWSSVAACASQATALLQRRVASENESNRFQRMLEITQSWNHTRETDTLLFDMAEAATQLLDAERATIFLWDRANKTLVGRPALGVEGGELRIPEDAGVVGQVVQSGEPQRVDEDIATEQKQIHRDVDEELNFQTRSLICVPMTVEDKTIGAFEVLNKSTGSFSDADLLALSDLAAHASVAIENTQHIERLATSRRQIAEEAAEKVHLIGECPAIVNLRKTVERVANTELSILILGENGTGKEVVAQMTHYWSQRRDQVLVAVNCAAITESLLESELFGHEKGAFTDAHQARPGKFESADGGTLFLDEIGDMSLGGQAKLLRVLEEKIVVRVGGSTPISVDTRVIAATNQNLAELVREKKFREDLFFRLNVVTIELPPLRERGDDVLLLADHFLEEFCSLARRKKPALTAAARKRLVGHTWPGNVRELRNLMERMAYLSEGDKIDADELAFIMSPKDAGSDSIALDQALADATKQFQVEYIRKHIERCRGNMTETALKLGLHRSNLYRKMRQLEMTEGNESDE